MWFSRPYILASILFLLGMTCLRTNSLITDRNSQRNVFLSDTAMATLCGGDCKCKEITLCSNTDCNSGETCTVDGALCSNPSAKYQQGQDCEHCGAAVLGLTCTPGGNVTCGLEFDCRCDGEIGVCQSAYPWRSCSTTRECEFI